MPSLKLACLQRGAQDEKARGFDFCAGFRNVRNDCAYVRHETPKTTKKQDQEWGHTVFVKELPEGLTGRVRYPSYHCVQCHLGGTDRPHAVVYPPRSEAPLDDLFLEVSRGLECTPAKY